MTDGLAPPEDIVAQVRRRWDDGRLLAWEMRGEALFPWRLRFSAPSVRDVTERFADVRAWAERLRAASREATGVGFSLEWTEHNHRATGRNLLPSGVIVPSQGDALGLLGRRADGAAFQDAARLTLAEFPTLAPFFARHPLKVLEHAARWADVVEVLRWFRTNPRSGRYLRQVDVAGVETKFIEERRALFADLLALTLERPVDRDATFEERFGLVAKAPLLRLRVLDPGLAVAGLTDLAAPVDQLARLPLRPMRVFVTENEVNGLAFPPVPDAVVVFGLGYGLLRLGGVPWMRGTRVHYWGDIDTHGFAMLDHVRGVLPDVVSFLMDRRTLLEHRTSWVREGEQHLRDLARLSLEETRLYDDLRASRMGDHVRLEQEHVRFGWLQAALQAL